MAWTPARIATLKQMWADGHSASEIARELGGGLSRNSVTGKLHRMGLMGQRKPSAPATKVSDTPEEIGDDKGVVVSLISSSPIIRECRWPQGNPASESFSFCGRSVVEGKSYCADHARIAYAPKPKKKAFAK